MTDLELWIYGFTDVAARGSARGDAVAAQWDAGPSGGCYEAACLGCAYAILMCLPLSSEPSRAIALYIVCTLVKILGDSTMLLTYLCRALAHASAFQNSLPQCARMCKL